jgi:hypothetical protein
MVEPKSGALIAIYLGDDWPGKKRRGKRLTVLPGSADNRESGGPPHRIPDFNFEIKLTHPGFDREPIIFPQPPLQPQPTD